MRKQFSRRLRSLLAAKASLAQLESQFLSDLAKIVDGIGPAGRNSASAPVAASRRTLKCPRCARRFARPVHLGRHLSATHGVKRKRAA
jgi:hypothetical protein